MKDTRSIEQQVAELTQEQQDKIIKVGTIASLLELIGLIPMLITLFWQIVMLISPPMGYDWADKRTASLGAFVIIAICFAYIIGVLLFVKIKYPYYSDAKCKYIKKMRKSGN